MLHLSYCQVFVAPKTNPSDEFFCGILSKNRIFFHQQITKTNGVATTKKQKNEKK